MLKFNLVLKRHGTSPKNLDINLEFESLFDIIEIGVHATALSHLCTTLPIF